MLVSGKLLFYSGVAIMATAVIGALVAIVILTLSRKRLQARLDEEFGKKRR